ncbi:MAG: serine/threonine protein kinase [Candidatus Riflebacteria bacterium]|nr:serine/threonine protein kinase [Candidatus Riflebacteria bacterium]
MTASSPGTGDRVGGYRLERKLGSGGTGTVFVARRSATSRPVALKILHGLQGEPREPGRQFANQRRLLESVDHPNVVRVLGGGVDGPVPFLVMELVVGPTLRRRLQRGPLVGSALSTAGEQLLSALSSIHDAGIVHRDLTPSNLILQEGRLVVLDFGLARLVGDETVTRSRGILMTVAYAAPERFRGLALTALSDIYQAGLVLFEMATGSPPFTGRDPSSLATAHLTRPPPAARALDPGLPPLIDRVLDKALRKVPEERYADAASFRDDWLFVLSPP